MPAEDLPKGWQPCGSSIPTFRVNSFMTEQCQLFSCSHQCICSAVTLQRNCSSERVGCSAVQLPMAVHAEMRELQTEVSRVWLSHKSWWWYPMCMLQFGATQYGSEAGIGLHSKDILDPRRTSVVGSQVLTWCLLW